MLKEDIEIWDCGVEIKEVDEYFRFNDTVFKNMHFVYINLLDDEEIAINNILNKYGKMDAIQLNFMSVNQKVRSSGVVKEGNINKHVSNSVLIEEFSNK